MAERDKLERRSSKSKLSKQDEVEEHEDDDNDNSPSSEASDATVIPAGTGTPTSKSPGGSPDDSPEEKSAHQLESQRSTDSDKGSPTQSTHPKVKLLKRSHALRDDASPPPDELTIAETKIITATPTVTVLTIGRPKLEKDNSQSSTISDTLASPCLSRDSSVETQYTDSTGIDLEEFITRTLNKNSKDRIMLLKMEQELTNFIKDPKTHYLKFPPMSSYHRMLVHRVAAFFGLDHNVDQSGKSVIVNKTGNTRIPDFRFEEHIRDEKSQDDQPKKQILKRESASFDETRDGSRLDSKTMEGKKSKSFEEREQEYERTRARIFNQQDSQSSQDGQEGQSPASSRPSTRHSSARSSKEDLRWAAEPRPWSSTDSSGYGTDTSMKNKVHMTKASSFGGVTVFSRGDSRASSGRLSKTDSLSSGTSSSLGSPMTRPPPIPSSPPPVSESSGSSQSASSPSLQHQEESPSPLPPLHCTVFGGQHSSSSSSSSSAQSLPFDVQQGQPVYWVASSLDAIPPGSMLINPQTGQPYLNPDGSKYRYYPQQSSSSSGATSLGATTMHGMSSPHSVSPQQQVAPPGTMVAPPMPPPPSVPQLPPPHQQSQPQLPQQATQGTPVYQHYAMPPPPPQATHLMTVDQRQYSGDSSGSDISAQMSSMTLTPQSSTESMPEQPPGGHPGGALYVIQQPVPPGMPPQVPQPPQPPQQQTHSQHQAFLPPQVYYSPNQATGSQPVRYMYQPMSYMASAQPQLQGQGSMEGQGQPQQQPQQQQQQSVGQQQAQNVIGYPSSQQQYVQGAYQGYGAGVMGGGGGAGGYPTETTAYATQQSYPPPPQPPQAASGQPPPPQQQPGYPPAPPPQPPQQTPQPQNPQELGYSTPQYQNPTTVSQGTPYVQTAMPAAYYNNLPPNSSASSQIISYPGGQGQQQQPGVQVSLSGQGYRPRTPPGGGNIGQPMSAPQYMAYSYAQFSQQQQVAPSAQQQQQRAHTPQGVSFPKMPPVVVPSASYPSTVAATGMRPMTTPPPPPGPPGAPPPQTTMAYPPQMPGVMQGAAGQLKMFTVDQRPPKSSELYNPDGSGVGCKDPALMAAAAAAMQPQVLGVAKAPASMSQMRQGTTAQYRPPTPIGDVRLLGTSIPMFQRPQLQPLFTQRPKFSGVHGSGNKSCRSRRTARLHKDGSGNSPHTSIESSDSSAGETSSCAAHILEVYDLPGGAQWGEAESLLDELTNQGAGLHCLHDDKLTINHLVSLSECVVLAVFDSEASAQSAFSKHKNPKYKLRPSQRHLDLDLQPLEAPS